VVVATALFVAGYCACLAVFGSGAAAGSDASGYLNEARLLASGTVRAAVRMVPGVPAGTLQPRELSPLGFKLGRERGTVVPTYPVGLPLHLVAAAWLGGWAAAGITVNTAAAAVALYLLYLLARRLGLPPAWSAACVVAFAVFPVTFRSYTWVFSDGLATTWCLATVYSALRAGEGRRWALLAGVSFGIAVLVRPTDALIIGAVLLALPRRWSVIATFLAGSAPAVVALGLLNRATFGTVVATGYSTGASRLAWSYFLPRIVHFGVWISRFLTPAPLLALPLAAWRALRGDRRQQVLLAWVAGIVGFYAFYFNSIETWWYLRFILPAMPAVVLSAAIALHHVHGQVLAPHGHRAALAGGALLLAVAALAVALSGRFVASGRLWLIGRGEEIYPASVAELGRRAGDRAAVVCELYSGAVYFYGSLATVRYDNLQPGSYERLRAAARASGTALFALLADGEVPDLREGLPGRWDEIWRREHTVILTLRDGPSASTLKR
jgi:hypothetical protein